MDIFENCNEDVFSDAESNAEGSHLVEPCPNGSSAKTDNVVGTETLADTVLSSSKTVSANTMKIRRNGAQKRRLRYWLGQGKSWEEASVLCMQPLDITKKEIANHIENQTQNSEVQNPCIGSNEIVNNNEDTEQALSETLHSDSEDMVSPYTMESRFSAAEKRKIWWRLRQGKTMEDAHCLSGQSSEAVRINDEPVDDFLDNSESQSHSLHSYETTNYDDSSKFSATKPLSGAQRRRLHYWLGQGKSFEEASVLCIKPYKTTRPELYNDHRASKRQHSEDPYPSHSSIHPNKISKVNHEDDLAVISRPDMDHKNSSSNYCPQNIKVGIKDVERPIKYTEMNLIQDSIVNLIDSMEEGEEGPKFRPPYIKLGCFIITCADELSCHWLITHLDKIKPWQGANLILVDVKELSNKKIATAWIKDKAVDNKTLLNRLSKQNNELNCKNWMVLRKTIKANGQLVTFSIDKDSYYILQKRNFMVYNGVSPFYLKFKDLKNKEQTSLSPDSVEHSDDNSDHEDEFREPFWEPRMPIEPEKGQYSMPGTSSSAMLRNNDHGNHSGF